MLLFVAIPSFAKNRHQNLNMRQRKTVAVVKNNVTSSYVELKIQITEDKAEILDQTSKKLMQFVDLNPLQRWAIRKEEENLQNQFAMGLTEHIVQMTELFRMHRISKSFQRLEEFEFRNLLVKSDYLLGIYFSKQSLEIAGKNKIFAQKISTALTNYNSERIGIDQKILQISFISAI